MNFVNNLVFNGEDMFKQIYWDNPILITFNFRVEWSKYPVFFHEKNKEFYILFLENKIYLDKFGFYHRIDGKTYTINFPDNCFYWIHGEHYFAIEFAQKTNHLICKVCNEFCKQGCFM